MLTLEHIISDVKTLNTRDDLVRYINHNVALHKQDIVFLEERWSPRPYTTDAYIKPFTSLFVFIFQYSQELKELDSRLTNLSNYVAKLQESFPSDQMVLACFDVQGYLKRILSRKVKSIHYVDFDVLVQKGNCATEPPDFLLTEY